VNYNLLDEKWIPALYNNGINKRVNLMEALMQASRIREIASANPMDRVAILRFLLALLYWCKGNPPDAEDEIARGPFPRDWFKKLDDNKDCFDLLGDGKRFYQDLTAKRPRPATVLIQELPAGHNFWHFKHSTDNKSGLCSACCATGLLRLPLFAVSSLSGPGEPNLMAGINGVPPVYAAPWGKSLLETLRANWTACGNIGEPSWGRYRATQEPDADVPLLTGLTLLPRRVFLHDPIKTGYACAGCAARELPLILGCEYQTAGKQENAKWNDPHALYSGSGPRKAMRAADLTASGRFRLDRPWADLLVRILETRKPTALLVVGFATNKAKNIDVWECTIDIPPTTSVQEVAPALARKWQLEGRVLEEEIKKVTRSKGKGAAIIAALRPTVESSVSEKVGELISQDSDAWEQATHDYSPMMAAVARSLSPGYTIAALQRRRQIANVKPDMRLKVGGAEKTDRKKGGGK